MMFFVFSQLLCKPVLQFDQLNFQGFESRYLKIHIALIRTNLSFCSNFEKVLESYLFFLCFSANLFCRVALEKPTISWINFCSANILTFNNETKSNLQRSCYEKQYFVSFVNNARPIMRKVKKQKVADTDG